MNIDEVKATVGRGNEAAERAMAMIMRAADRIDEASRLTAVTRGTEHQQVRLGLARLQEATVEAKRAFGLLHAGAEAAEEFRRALG